MEEFIYELYILHLIKVKLLSVWPLEDGEQYIMANQLLLRIEKQIIRSIVSNLDDLSLFSNFLDFD